MLKVTQCGAYGVTLLCKERETGRTCIVNVPEVWNELCLSPKEHGEKYKKRFAKDVDAWMEKEGFAITHGQWEKRHTLERQREDKERDRYVVLVPYKRSFNALHIDNLDYVYRSFGNAVEAFCLLKKIYGVQLVSISSLVRNTAQMHEIECISGPSPVLRCAFVYADKREDTRTVSVLISSVPTSADSSISDDINTQCTNNTHKRVKAERDASIANVLQVDKTSNIYSLEIFTLYGPEVVTEKNTSFIQTLAFSITYVPESSTEQKISSNSSNIPDGSNQSSLLSYVYTYLEKKGIDCAILYNLDKKIFAESPYYWQKEMPVCILSKYVESVKRLSEYSLMEMVREYKINISPLFVNKFAPFVEKMQKYEIDICSISAQEPVISAAAIFATQMHALFKKGQLMELAYMLSKITGCSLTDIFGGNKSDRVEALLLRRIRDAGFLLPKKKRCEERDPTSTYEGGYVFLDHPGVYDSTYTALFDFNSLYPSIIQEYNVCFSTADRLTADNTNNTEEKKIAKTFLPETVRALVEQRSQVKEKMKKASKEKISVLNVEQNAIKLVANCIYGCLGYQGFRFYNKKMASFITERGRAILQDTKCTFEQMGYRVIYGDTDSVMVDTGVSSLKPPPSPELFLSMSAQVTKKYKNIYLEFEKVFRKIVMLAKKKYFGVYCTKDGDIIEEKGLETGRRDWADVGQQISSYVLKTLLTHDHPEKEITQYLASKRQEVAQMPRESFIIRKRIAKNLSEYSHGQQQSLHQVALAVRMHKENKYLFRAGDIISFVIALHDGVSRAELPTEGSPIDIEYYIQMQILAPVQRMIEHFPSISLPVVKRALGIVHHVSHTPNTNIPANNPSYYISTSVPDNRVASMQLAKENEKDATMYAPCCKVIQILSPMCVSCGCEFTQEIVLSAIKAVVFKRMCMFYKIDRKCSACKNNSYSISPICLLCFGPLEDPESPNFENLCSFFSYIKSIFEDTLYSSTVDTLICYISKVPIDLNTFPLNAELSMLYAPALSGRIDKLDELLR